MHGVGRYKWSNSKEYSGGWKFGNMSEFGIFKWPDGRRYEGYFMNSKRHGEGRLYMPDGSVSFNKWRNNIVVPS